MRGNGSPEYQLGTNTTIPAAAAATGTSSFPVASFPWLDRPWNATTTGHGPAPVARVDVESECGVVEPHVDDVTRRGERRLHDDRGRDRRRRLGRCRRRRCRRGRPGRCSRDGHGHRGGARGRIRCGRTSGGDQRDDNRRTPGTCHVHPIPAAAPAGSVTTRGPFGRGPTPGLESCRRGAAGARRRRPRHRRRR